MTVDGKDVIVSGRYLWMYGSRKGRSWKDYFNASQACMAEKMLQGEQDVRRVFNFIGHAARRGRMPTGNRPRANEFSELSILSLNR